MKKRLFAAFLAVVIACVSLTVAFATATYSGTITGDQIIYEDSNINDDAVFTGKVTIATGATVSAGTFNGDVTVEKGKVTNWIITSVEDTPVTGGTFNGNVTANGILGGGTYTGSVTNNNKITSGTFKNTVTNAASATISGGVYYGAVNNSGTISGGTFYNVINNSGTVNSGVTAIVHETSDDTYSVHNYPTINSNVTIGGNSFTLAEGKTLTIEDGAKVTINSTADIAGTIYVKKGGSLVLNGAKGTSNGTIRVYDGGSISGRKVSDYQYITYKQHNITVQSNVDLSEFTFFVGLSLNQESTLAFKNDTVYWSLDLAAAYQGCLTVNSVVAYKDKVKSGNEVSTSSSTSGSFTMPDSDVVFYVDCTTNHAYKNYDATCTTAGYKQCERCNHVVNTQDALGHAWNEWVYNTDSDSNVLKTRSCSRCTATENAYVELLGYTSSRKEDYKTTITYYANVKAPSGYTVYFVVDGKEIKAVDSEKDAEGHYTYTVKEAVNDYTVQVRVKGLSVSGVSESEEETVNIKHGFFDKLIAIFRGWFGKLPVIHQK